MAGAPAHTNSNQILVLNKPAHLTNISEKMQKQEQKQSILVNSSKYFTFM